MTRTEIPQCNRELKTTAHQCPSSGENEHVIANFGQFFIIHLCDKHSLEHEAAINEMTVPEWITFLERGGISRAVERMLQSANAEEPQSADEPREKREPTQ